MSQRPVKPRHAASLVLTRKRDGVTQILMGRRPAKAVFPEAYVVPGGRVDPSDASVAPSAAMSAQALAELCARGGCTPSLARALATTAIRETFEETGLILAGSGDTGRRDGAWEHFAGLGLAPAHTSHAGFAGTPHRSEYAHELCPASRQLASLAPCGWRRETTLLPGWSAALAFLRPAHPR